jgi:hypothetical protein
MDVVTYRYLVKLEYLRHIPLILASLTFADVLSKLPPRCPADFATVFRPILPTLSFFVPFG